MMEYKVLGCIMILPTIIAAFWIMKKTYGLPNFWINVAVMFWILANASWMVIEFFHLTYKVYTLPFFLLGIVAFIRYLFALNASMDE